MILGFGSSEEQSEKEVGEKLIGHVLENYDDVYFSDDFCEKVNKWARQLARESQELSESYKEAVTFPDRYSYFWVSTVHSASHIVFIVSFHHINRRHAFSPDGWAMLQTEKLFHVASWDAKKHRKADVA